MDTPANLSIRSENELHQILAYWAHQIRIPQWPLKMALARADDDSCHWHALGWSTFVVLVTVVVVISKKVKCS
jgi:hypothetical protein